MRYYKNIKDGYIIAIGIGEGFIEITEAEYNELSEVISNKPRKEGYWHRLKEDLSWEAYESPVIEEITAEEAETLQKQWEEEIE